MPAFTPLPNGRLTTPLSILLIFIVHGIYNFEYDTHVLGDLGNLQKKAFIYQTSGALVLRDTFLR